MAVCESAEALGLQVVAHRYLDTPEAKQDAAEAYEAAIATWRTYPGPGENP